MSSAIPICAQRTKSYPAALVHDVDGVKTTFATVAGPVTLVPADFNGAQVLAGGVLDLPRTVTVTRSNNANQFSTNPIVVTGRRGGDVVVESIAQPNDDGNDELRGTQLFDAIASIAIPTNGGTGGTLQIGVQDIGCPAGSTFLGVKLHADGPLNVQYGERAGANTDSIPCLAHSIERCAAKRVLTSPALSAPTVAGLTVYIP